MNSFTTEEESETAGFEKGNSAMVSNTNKSLDTSGRWESWSFTCAYVTVTSPRVTPYKVRRKSAVGYFQVL